MPNYEKLVLIVAIFMDLCYKNPMSILTPDFAEKFIQEIVGSLPYNVNIMDENGIIIASKSAERIGDFHEVAYGLLTGNMKTGVVREQNQFIGTKPGINMLVNHRDRHVGVICVTGDPKSVESFAGFVKRSIEAMLDYEIRMAREGGARDREEEFMKYLLFSENYQHNEARRMAGYFNMDKRSATVVIILRVPPGPTDFSIIRALSRPISGRRSNIVLRGRTYDYIVLKFLEPHTAVGLSSFRKQVTDYIDEAIQGFPQEIDTTYFQYYVGSIQVKMHDYRKSFHHAQYLYLYLKNSDRINFFCDHVADFARKSVPLNLFRDIYEPFVSAFSPSERMMLIKTIKALESSNYNFIKASRELYVHRNTILFRINKIRDTLMIDPINSGSDREFLHGLAFYLENIE